MPKHPDRPSLPQREAMLLSDFIDRHGFVAVLATYMDILAHKRSGATRAPETMKYLGYTLAIAEKEIVGEPRQS